MFRRESTRWFHLCAKVVFLLGIYSSRDEGILEPVSSREFPRDFLPSPSLSLHPITTTPLISATALLSISNLLVLPKRMNLNL